MSNIPEHSALGSEPNPDIPDEDQVDVKMVMDIFKKYKKHRDRYDRNWLHYYKMWRGDQWSGVKMPKYRQQEVVNMIWSAVQSSVPLQTDVRPKMNFIPTEPQDKEFAEVLTAVSDSDWERYNWLTVITEIVIDGYIYGIGWGGLGYDPEIEYGLGAAEFESEDPFYMYPDPEAVNVNGKRSLGIIKAEPVSTERLKQQYPDQREHIKSDIKDLIQSSKTALNDFKINTTSTDREMPDTTFLDGETKAVPKTLLITAYLKPEETEEIEETETKDDGEEETKFIIKKKYPFGRVVKIASGVKLEESKLPFAHGLFPFARYQNFVLPRELFGVSEVEQLESPQRIFNKLLNASLEILNLMGNPIWVVDSSSGVNPDQLVNRTGLVVEKEPGSEVRREMGMQLNPTALQLIDRMETWFNNVAGTTDVSQGKTPGSVTAASAIEQLQDAARTRIRQKQRNLDAFIREIGQQYAAVILEKYDKARVFRVTNSDESTKFFKFRTDKRVNEESGNEELVGILTQFEDNPEGQLVPAGTREFLISGRFDVRVNTGSSLPFAVADKEQKAFQLFDRGIIDEEEVLNTIDYPNKEKVLERIMQRKQAEAEAAQNQGA